jgi:hypothetical protein
MSDSDEGNRKKSDIKFLHDKRNVSISNGHKIVHEEYVIDGSKGVMIKFYHKEGDEFNKVTIKALEDGTYRFISSSNNEDKREEIMSKKDLLKELNKSKMMKFAVEYLEKQKGGYSKYNNSENDYDSRDKYSNSDYDSRDNYNSRSYGSRRSRDYDY